MDEPYISRPDVARMIRLAVKRAKNMFAAYQDLDADSLFADMFGVVSLAPYKPEKMAPRSFAYMCASRRLRDISRKRSLELRHFDKSLAQNGVRLSHVYASEIRENTPAEIEERLYGYWIASVTHLEGLNIPVRPVRCVPPDADRAQRAAMHLIQTDMDWTCRDAEAFFRDHPSARMRIGVTYSPSRQFFSRSSELCHIVREKPEKLISAPHAA